MWVKTVLGWTNATRAYSRFISRLFTVPYFFVRSFRYTASYRHGSLGSFDTHARWVARNAKLSISMILRKNRGLWTVYYLSLNALSVLCGCGGS